MAVAPIQWMAYQADRVGRDDNLAPTRKSLVRASILHPFGESTKSKNNMKKTQLYLLALIIAAIGLAAFYYKWKVLSFPIRAAEQTELWEIQARVQFQARKGPNKVTLQIPRDPPGYDLIDEKFVARNYGMNIEQGKRTRAVQWQFRNARGNQALYYRATVYRDLHASEYSDPPPREVSPSAYEEPYLTARSTLLEQVREKSVDSASFAGQLVRALGTADNDSSVALLMDGIKTAEQRAHLAKGLLADRQISARVIHGLPLVQSDATVPLMPFLQVWDGEAQRWDTISAESGVEGWPDDMFMWSISQRPVLEVEDNPRARVEFSVQRTLDDALDVAKERLEAKDRNLVAYSLLNLPLQTQDVYRILLMMPLGAFLMLLLRNVVGIKTFGTFMPVLVALAFRETKLVTGIILFTTVVSLGLLVRFYLEKLRLLLVPRLTAVLILVVFLMALVSVVSNKLGIDQGLSIALFPIVIMTMTIERMSIAWEERGGAFALKEGIGTLIVAVLAYLVMSIAWLEHLVFVFPELLLVLFALTLLIGRYSGYRISELFRFRALAADPVEPAPQKAD